MSATPLLAAAHGLRITFPGRPRPAVDGLDLTVSRGEILGIVGESGSGKSLTALALAGLAPTKAMISGGIALFGAPAPAPGDRAWRVLRGGKIGFVFQDALTGLNPVRTLGSMLCESARRHRGCDARTARALSKEALSESGIPDAERRLDAYPHQLSGGLRQRAMIALALLNDPELIIADEPTTALDAAVQAEILELLRRRAAGRGVIFITHDLNAAARLCDRVMVMRQGVCVESGDAALVFSRPRTDYARELLTAAATLDRPYPGQAKPPEPHSTSPSVAAKNVVVTYRTRRGPLYAVRGVSLELHRGRTLALVGESGSGKSTLARVLLGLERSTSGEVVQSGASTKQMVFQDPYSSLDPTWRVRDIIAEPISRRFPADRTRRVEELIVNVRLPADSLTRRPNSFSGGQRQRIAIARAIAPEPDVLIADEPVSALDVTIQSEIMALIAEIQVERKLAILLVSHDLALVRHCSHDVAVMYLGRVVERGETGNVVDRPAHPYTEALVAAARCAPKSLSATEPPSAYAPPSGCAFRLRCPRASSVCVSTDPDLVTIAPGRFVACHHPLTEGRDV
jgi:peptide/nickel transport system ATP-binding protein